MTPNSNRPDNMDARLLVQSKYHDGRLRYINGKRHHVEHNIAAKFNVTSINTMEREILLKGTWFLH